MSESDKISKGRLIFQVDQGHRSKQTAYKYKMHFQRFLDYIRIQDVDVFLDLGRDAIQVLVMNYTKGLRDNVDKKYTRGTVNNLVCPIIYFLDNNDIELNKRMIRRYFPSDESMNDDRLYSHEEVQRILSVCDLRTKAMILLMASTGMRIGALHSLKITHLTKIPKYGLYKVSVYAGTKYKYYTFCTPEAAKAIDEYLGWRARSKEVLKDESPLFRKHFNKNDPFTINIVNPLREATIHKNIDEVLKKAGVKTKEAMRSHAFRKGFKSVCEQAGMKSINIELLMGHNIGVSGHYYRPQEADILEDYIKAVDSLTISDELKLKQENQDLKTIQAQEIERLKAQLQGYKEEQEARAKQSHDISEQALEELRNRINETEDKYERMVSGLEYIQRGILRDKEREKKELEEMSPRLRKMRLDWEKTSEKKGESFVDYYARNRKKAN